MTFGVTAVLDCEPHRCEKVSVALRPGPPLPFAGLPAIVVSQLVLPER